MKKFISILLLLTMVMSFPITASAATASFGGSYGPNGTYSTASGKESDLLYPGDLFYFGSYEQDEVKENGTETITWLVLEADEHYALIISLYGLDAVLYQSGYEDVDWESCELRSWMNDTFYEDAFTQEEKGVILLASLDNSNAREACTMWRNMKEGNDTEDYVFALSCRQAEEIFGHKRGYSNGYNLTYLLGASKCEPTPYAVSRGGKPDNKGYCYWWLRSPSNVQFKALFVSPLGSEGPTNCYASNICARPAIMLNMEKIFIDRETSTYSIIGD